MFETLIAHILRTYPLKYHNTNKYKNHYILELVWRRLDEIQKRRWRIHESTLW